jgi:hypothetical protein
MAGSTAACASTTFSTTFALLVISWEKEFCDVNIATETKTSNTLRKDIFFIIEVLHLIAKIPSLL